MPLSGVSKLDLIDLIVNWVEEDNEGSEDIDMSFVQGLRNRKITEDERETLEEIIFDNEIPYDDLV